MVCGNFILPEPASYVFFYAFSNLRNLLYIIKYPQCCRQTDDDEQGGLTFEIEKGRLSFRLTAPYSEERRRAASEQAKQNGVHGYNF